MIDRTDIDMIKYLKNSSGKEKFKRLDILGENIKSDKECLSKRVITGRILSWQFTYHVRTKQVGVILIEKGY